MKLCYYRSRLGNFGDDLNDWLWPRIFPSINEHFSDDYFLGIGTILSRDFQPLQAIPTNHRKLVFGSGVRISDQPLALDNTWDVYFVRGKLSAKALGLDEGKAICDAAYCLRLLPEFDNVESVKKKYRISYIPYFKSVSLLNWEKLCKSLGWHYISPYVDRPIETILRDIHQSELILTEAMHGAIVADALRVPWKRVKFAADFFESSIVAEFKWKDTFDEIESYPYAKLPFLDSSWTKEKRVLHRVGDFSSRLMNYYRIKQKANSIEHPETFSLTRKDHINDIIDRLKVERNRLSEYM